MDPISPLAAADPWASSHGYIPENGFLGTLPLYFSLAYMMPAKMAVILGSGGGLIPSLVRQAQKAVPDPFFVQHAQTILIDANLAVHHFGMPTYHDAKDHPFRQNYPEIPVWKMTSEEGAAKLKELKIKIDFLHIDADHTFKESLADVERFIPLMDDDFVITLHDTARFNIEGLADGCVPRTVAHLRRLMTPGGPYEHLEMIDFNNRFQRPENYFGPKLECRGVAIIKPKKSTIWDHLDG